MNRRLVFHASALSLNTMLAASYYPAAKSVLEHFDPFEFAMLEVAVLLPIGFLCVLRARCHLCGGAIRAGIVTGLLFAASNIAMALSLKLTTATNACFLSSLDAPFALFVAYVFLRERYGGRVWMAAGVTVVGALLLIGDEPGPRDFGLSGNAWSVIGGLGYVVFLSCAQRDARRYSRMSGQDFLGVYLLTSVVFCTGAFVSVSGESSLASATAVDWLVLMYVGSGATLIPLIIELNALRHISAVAVSFVYALEPLWAALFAFVLLGEVIGTVAGLGAALMLFASVHFLARDDRAVPRPAARAPSPHRPVAINGIPTPGGYPFIAACSAIGSSCARVGKVVPPIAAAQRFACDGSAGEGESDYGSINASRPGLS
ncbi:MAG: DMT family transporter [Pseudomonadota bacterium]